jgi:hypothetical protein
LVAGAVPSLTSTVQSAGPTKPDLSILKEPELLLVVICTPSTVIAWLAAACPSIRNLLPLSSARDTPTAACAVPLKAADRPATATRMATPTTITRARNRRLGMESPDFSGPKFDF